MTELRFGPSLQVFVSHDCIPRRHNVNLNFELDTGHAVAGAKETRRKMAAVICLWLAYMTCNAAYSLFAPFLPEEV